MRGRIVSRAVPLSLLLLFISACATMPMPDGGRSAQPAELDDEPGSPLVERQLARMTLRERIGQRFLVHIPRSFDSNAGIDAAAFRRTIKQGAPAGIIVYPWNYDSRDGLTRTIEKLQQIGTRRHPRLSLLVAADQEGGRVLAVRAPNLIRPTAARDVARHSDEAFVENLAYVVGIELRATGVTMNLAPVLDLTAGRAGGIIGDRSFGADPEEVSRLAIGYLRGMRRAGVIATAKHFPGHGVTEIDSHGRLPRVGYTREELERTHIRPFAAAIEEGVPAIMTAHILFPDVDPRWPVTLSQRFLLEILRDDLGFEGVVVSDGLEMGALRGVYPLEDTLERAFLADVDLILLYASYDLLEVVAIVEALLAAGRISEADIDRGVRRVLALKESYGLLSE